MTRTAIVILLAFSAVMLVTGFVRNSDPLVITMMLGAVFAFLIALALNFRDRMPR